MKSTNKKAYFIEESEIT